MTEKAKKLSPPYATFGSFSSFLNKLRDTGIPNRIDPSVFGNASGSISYSVIASLKFLKLIDANGIPQDRFIQLVNASDEERKPILREVLKEGYPTLFSGSINLQNATAAQFDEIVRNEYAAKGSTVDKIAAFFISAANAAEIPLSAHLKARKPSAPSPTSRKSSRQRTATNGEAGAGAAKGGDAGQQQIPAQEAKPLEYQLIDLMSEPDIDDGVKDSIWSLVQYLTMRKAKKAAAQSPEPPSQESSGASASHHDE